MTDNELFGNSEQLEKDHFADYDNMVGDTISRAAAIKTAHLPVIDDASYEVVRMDDILALPSVQPTLYGYDIKHLAFVASIMAKKGVSPEEAVTIFRDVNRVIEMMLEDMKEMQENELKQALKKPWEGEKHGTSRAVLSQKPVR